MANKKSKKDMSLTEALGSILPGIGTAFKELIYSMGHSHDKKAHNHSVNTDDATAEMPNMGWTKKNIKSYMHANDVKYNSGDTKKDLLQKIKWASK